jgi:hypothetical protein
MSFANKHKPGVESNHYKLILLSSNLLHFKAKENFNLKNIKDIQNIASHLAELSSGRDFSLICEDNSGSTNLIQLIEIIEQDPKLSKLKIRKYIITKNIFIKLIYKLKLKKKRLTESIMMISNINDFYNLYKLNLSS